MVRRDVLYMILAALCLAFIGIFIKLIGDSVPIMTVNFLRLFIGFLGLIIIIPFVDTKWYKVTKKELFRFFIIGIIYAVTLSLFAMANLFGSIQNAVLINSSYPFFVLFFGYLLIKEKVTTTKIITLIIAFIGLMIINPFQFSGQAAGNIFALANTILYGLMIVEMRKERKTHSVGDIVWFLFFGAVVLLPFPFIYGVGDFSSVWIYVVLLGVVSTAFAYLFYNLALRTLDAETCSIVAMIVTPLVSIVLAVLFISEEINIRTIIGGAILIIAGIYLETHVKKIKKKGTQKREPKGKKKIDQKKKKKKKH